ncbi:MAG TPA: N,N-dimethylformamidase beta subunit family domain-containing protein [Roseimicrobium sp.]|nr:N,N-dimethylformamidase beta subunit family domain-containing protein [Roseimicrobium sp.]
MNAMTFRALIFTTVLNLVAVLHPVGAAETVPPLFIEGYAAQQSYAPGEEAAVHVSTSAAKYSVEIVRIGAQTNLVWSKRDLPGKEYPVPDDASSMGCRWPESFRVPVAKDWKSGYYAVRFRAEDSGGRWSQRGRRSAESEAFFVVRSAEPGKTSKILLQLAANTYNAYNNWGGFSVYAYNSLGKNQGSRVSFERPPAPQFRNWELPFIQWAERNGYALDFAINSDLEFRPELLSKYKLVLSVGHDEYWSGPMRDNLEKYIAGGGNVAFFSGNSVCWQVRTEDDGRAFTCFKQNYFQDPVWKTGDFKTLSTAWSHHLLKRPENSLTGVGFLQGGYRKSHGQFMNDPAEYTVHRADHWVFEGTGVNRDDKFGDKDTIVGYECDGCELEWKNGLPFPTYKDGTPKTFTVLATCPVRWHPDDAEWYERWEKGRTGNACLGVYTQGGTVFTSGSTDWAHGLRGGDKIVDRMTRNILERLGK